MDTPEQCTPVRRSRMQSATPDLCTPIRRSKVQPAIVRRNVLESGSESEEADENIQSIDKVHKKKKRASLKSAKKKLKKPQKLLKLDYSSVNISFEPPQPEFIKPKMRWSAQEKVFFMNTLDLYKPRSEREWNSLLKTLKYDLNVDECKEAATKFGWIHPDDKPKKESNLEIAPSNLDMTIAEEAAVTARVKTAARAIQVDKLNQKAMAKPTEFAAPCEKKEEASEDADHTDDSLCIDRSVLELMFTPKTILPVPRAKFQVVTQVVTPKTPSFDETDSSASSFISLRTKTQGQRERQIRHIHAGAAKPRKGLGNTTTFTNRTKYLADNELNFDDLFGGSKAKGSDVKKEKDLLPEERDEEENYFSEESEHEEVYVDFN